MIVGHMIFPGTWLVSVSPTLHPLASVAATQRNVVGRGATWVILRGPFFRNHKVIPGHLESFQTRPFQFQNGPIFNFSFSKGPN